MAAWLTAVRRSPSRWARLANSSAGAGWTRSMRKGPEARLSRDVFISSSGAASRHETRRFHLAGCPCHPGSPVVASAQSQPGNTARIGLLGDAPSFLTEAFRQGLRELGYVEGQSIRIEHRPADWKHGRLPALAAELVRMKVDVIVAVNTRAIDAAKQATRTIPIVFTVSGDPVAEGLAASLARPGGNLTGLATISPELVG